MVQCCVVGCKCRSERKLENITFHTFPEDKNVRKMWFKATGRQDWWAPTKYTRKCSAHFESRFFRKTEHKVFLDKFAVPTLKLPNDMENYIQYRVMGSVSQVRMKKGCLPTKFECQSDKTKRTTKKRSCIVKKMLIGDLEQELDEKNVHESHAEIRGPSTLSSDGAKDSTASSRVCQVIKEEPATAQTSKDDPLDVAESPHASTTESAESGTEDTANLTTSWKTQTSIADESMDYSIDQFKCNTIISNVYRYLLKEYMSLKSQLRGICDVSVLSNTLARTAAATGVSQDEVEMALRQTALHSNQPSKREETHSSADVHRPVNILRNKRRFKTLEEDKSDDSLRPPKRKATSNSIPSQSSDEEKLPFPAPIQLRVHGVETECKIEPVDEPPTMDDLEPEASSRCGTGEGTEMEFKTELVDDESPQNIKDDPLEWSPTALEEPSDPPDVSHTEVKSEHLDHDYAAMSCGHSMYDKKHPDIKPKPPSQ